MNRSLLHARVVSVAISAVVFASCDPTDHYSQEPRKNSESPEKQERAAGDLLAKELSSTFVATPTDEVVLTDFYAKHLDYEAVATVVVEQPDLTRFDSSIAPPRYYTFSGKEGPISELTGAVAQLLLRRHLPEVIDEDLRPTTHDRELQFVYHRSGTVVAGVSKGIAFAPSAVPGALTDNLDNLTAVQNSIRNVDSKCAYRKIEGDWYLFVCI